MNVDTTVGPTLKTVLKVRIVAEGWPETPSCSMATHCEYQILMATANHVSMLTLQRIEAGKRRGHLAKGSRTFRHSCSMHLPGILSALSMFDRHLSFIVRFLSFGMPGFGWRTPLTLPIQSLNARRRRKCWRRRGRGRGRWRLSGWRLVSGPRPPLGCGHLQQQARKEE